MKSIAKTSKEIFDQVAKAKEALDGLNQCVMDDRGEFQEGVVVRSRLNAAKAHVMRAIEKAQTLK
ncbi:MAG: hypothetical protein H7839_00045 [Magnetococcus sp. YQC-5]